jgi:acyl-CoA thioester hydrolase
MGRTELLRANGHVYRDLEKAGVFFVVAELNLKFRQPALYDESLELTTTCSGITPAKVIHSYKLIRPESSRIIAEGTSILVCVNKDGKIQRTPGFMIDPDSNSNNKAKNI